MDEDACELVLSASLVLPYFLKLRLERGGEGAKGLKFGVDEILLVGEGSREGSSCIGEDLTVFSEEGKGSREVLFKG